MPLADVSEAASVTCCSPPPPGIAEEMRLYEVFCLTMLQIFQLQQAHFHT